MTTDLVAHAQAGDGEAFRQLVEPHRRELQVRCYRILGSAQDAEDALQETLLAAWQGLSGFEGRASVRTWLYRVATSRCLNALRSRSRRPPPSGLREPPAAADSASEQELVTRLTRAYATGDVDDLIALLTDDVWLTMPPSPLEYQGTELTGRFLKTIAFRQDRRYHLITTGANGQLAFGCYVRDPRAGVARANGLLVLTLAGSKICALTRFDEGVLPRFGLPLVIPA